MKFSAWCGSQSVSRPPFVDESESDSDSECESESVADEPDVDSDKVDTHGLDVALPKMDNLGRRTLLHIARTITAVTEPMKSRCFLNDGATWERLSFNSQVSGIRVSAAGADDRRIILHFHGGAFCLGSVWLTRELIGRLSAATQAHVISVGYRLAPRNPFPAALDDALAAWRWIRHQYPDASVAVAGDSAGGNLAFALLVKLAQLQEPQPVACVAMSPWLLLDVHGMEQANAGHLDKSIGYGVSLDAWQKGSVRMVERYCGDHPTSDPLVSPVLAGQELVEQFPPVLIHAAEGEPPHLVEDARNMAALCQRCGVAAECKLYPETLHVFQSDVNNDSAPDSMQQIGVFLGQHWGR